MENCGVQPAERLEGPVHLSLFLPRLRVRPHVASPADETGLEKRFQTPRRSLSVAFLCGSETPLPSVALLEATLALPAPLQPRALTVSKFWLLPTSSLLYLTASRSLRSSTRWCERAECLSPTNTPESFGHPGHLLGCHGIAGIAWSTQGRLQDEGFPWAQAPLSTDHTLSLLCLATS